MPVAEDSFVARVLGQLKDVEGIGCRAMFGGHGLYRGRTFFGIVIRGRLYLKADAATAAEHARRGMRPFHADPRHLLATYYEVPGEVLESRERLGAWVATAARAASAAGAGFKASPYGADALRSAGSIAAEGAAAGAADTR